MRSGYMAVAAVLAVAISAGPCAAQSFPAKPVRIVSPFPAGGGTDIVARLIARQMVENTGQSFIVENRVGAAGMIGCEAVARAAPDGYTLLMGTTGTHTTNPAVFARMSYDPIRDFAPVSLVAALPFVLVVHPSVPVRNLKELIALARAKPESLNYASSGVGGIAHLGFALLNTLAGTRMTHVPYKGSPLQTQATVAGEIAMTLDSIAVTQPFIKAGRIRALGVGAGKRSALMPEVPTIAEAGLPGYELVVWYALFAPAATPPEIVRLLQREVVRGLAGRNVAQDFGALGAEPVGGTPDELAGVVQRDLKKWAKVAQEAGVKAE